MHDTAGPVTFREGHTEVDGFSIRYLEAGQGDEVVILEGATWGTPKLRDALARKYRVVALEMPGFGASPANTRSASARDLAATTVLATAEILPDRYTLVGASFAAHVALWHTLLAPERVESLVLVSPTALLPAGDLPVGNPGDNLSALLAHPENAARLPQVDPHIQSKEQDLVRRLGGGAHDGEAERRLGEIHCPTLVVFGSQDRLVAGSAGSVYRRDIPNSNLSIVYDAGHLIEADRPEALINTVLDYIERRETFVVSRRSCMINP